MRACCFRSALASHLLPNALTAILTLAWSDARIDSFLNTSLTCWWPFCMLPVHALQLDWASVLFNRTFDWCISCCTHFHGFPILDPRSPRELQKHPIEYQSTVLSWPDPQVQFSSFQLPNPFPPRPSIRLSYPSAVMNRQFREFIRHANFIV